MAYGTINADLMTTSDGVSSSGLYGFKNRIINGAMVIDQRATTVTTASTFTVDRWQVDNLTTSGGVSFAQSSTAPAGFNNSLKITVTSADSSVAVSDIVEFRQWVEGYNFGDLNFGSANAQAVTLSFWVNSSITGTYGVSLRNSDSNRVYVSTYTISSANTWEQKTITVAGDTTGTWLTTNGRGLGITFAVMAGSNFQGTANTWGTTNNRTTSAQANLLATNGATFYITGVQLEKGSTATSFDYRDYGRELMLCQRYYYGYVSGSGKLVARGGYYSSTQVEGSIYFPTTMRTTPTLVATSGTNYYIVYRGGGDDAINSLTLNNEGSAASVSVYNNADASGTIGYAAQIATNNASASVAFNAEL